jgi:putative serine protease PepD
MIPSLSTLHARPIPRQGPRPRASRRRGLRLLTLVSLLGAVGLAGCAGAPAAPADARRARIDRIVASSAKILVERDGKRVSTGSGVVVASRSEGPDGSPESYILTSSHLLDGKDGVTLFVRFPGDTAPGKKLGAALVRRGDSETQDLALLRVAGIAVPPVSFSVQDEVRLGEEILIVGFPWGRRLGLFSGIVSQVPTDSREKQEAAAGDSPEQSLMVDATAAKGVSGGGVFHAGTGELIGIVEGYGTTSIAVQGAAKNYSLRVPLPGETFVVPVDRIRKFVEASGLAAQ